MESIDYGRALPLYAQVKEVLRHEIGRSMQPGDLLATEPELEKRFNVSRITVRRALDELAAEGLVVRRQGLGTFVRERPITQELTTLLSWTTAMRQLGYEPQTVQCEIDVVEPDDALRRMLQLDALQKVMRIWRVRHASGQPLCIMTNYLPEGVVPNLEHDGLKDDSVYATLAAQNLTLVSVEDTVEARAATEREIELLALPAWCPLLQVTRISYNAANQPIDVAIVASRADRYRYTVHFSPRARADYPLARIGEQVNDSAPLA